MKKSAVEKLDELFENEKIIQDNLETVMGERFGRYSKYIIQDRAIPDVRDGLKPVQRRILFAMYKLGMFSDKPYKKSARIVGEVIGKYHPHGDTSVYDAMVRLSQDFKMGVPLIDMHGNNGSIDGDPAAAMRYTEARLSPYAMHLLGEIDKKTVQFIPNFDDCEYEPVVLPAKFPNLLVNGSTGISAGYATDIPPHNYHEIIDLAIAKVKNPFITIDEIMQIVKGPDFPTGGIIEGIDEIKKAFETGKGKIYIKSKTEIEENLIIITEIPYEVNKAQLVRKIDEIRISKKIDGIVEVRDESDKDGLRIVVETKKQSNPEVILTYLFKNTDLAVNYSYNMVAISNKTPKLMGISEIIDAYVLHSKEITRNRANFEYDQANKRLHIVQGIIKLISVLDEAIEIIKSSKNKADAKQNLANKYGFTDIQTEAIVTLQLYRLTNTDILEMRQEEESLNKKITKLEKILKNEKELEKVIIDELTEIKEKYPYNRKTEVKEFQQKIVINEAELFIHEQVRVQVTRDNYFKRSSLRSYQASEGAGIKENDVTIFNEELNTNDTLLLFTNKGSYINIPVYKIPETKWKDLGEFIGGLFDMHNQETVIKCFVVKQEPKEGLHVLLATRDGLVKQVLMSELFKSRNRKGQVMQVKNGNEVVGVDLENEFDEDVIVSTKLGFINRYSKHEVPVLGTSAMGVKGIALKQGDQIASISYVTNFYKDEVILLTNKGAVKRVNLTLVPRSHRTNRGTQFLKVVKSNPYYFLAHFTTNVFRLKEYIDICLITDKNYIKVAGIDLKQDKYEHGAPYIDTQVEIPYDLYFIEQNNEEIYKVYSDLEKTRTKKEEETKQSSGSENLLLSELEDILTSDGQMNIFDVLGEEDMDDETINNKLKETLF